MVLSTLLALSSAHTFGFGRPRGGFGACQLHTLRMNQPPALRPPPRPPLCVLDLDMCVWRPEMYELYDIPTESDAMRGDLNGRGEGVSAVRSGAETISIFPGALAALQQVCR